MGEGDHEVFFIIRCAAFGLVLVSTGGCGDGDEAKEDSAASVEAGDGGTADADGGADRVEMLVWTMVMLPVEMSVGVWWETKTQTEPLWMGWMLMRMVGYEDGSDDGGADTASETGGDSGTGGDDGSDVDPSAMRIGGEIA